VTPFSPTRFVFVAVTLALVGCGAGIYPSGLSARGLSLPVGEKQITGSAGPKWRRTTDTDVGVTGFVGYRFGLTDSIDYQFPVSMALSWRGGAAEAAISGGVIGFGVRGAGDQTQYLLPLALALAAKYHISAATALVGVGRGSRVQSLNGGSSSSGLGGNLALVADVAEVISLTGGAGIEVSWEAGVSHRVLTFGGLGTDGYAAMPLVSIHVWDELDLMVAPGIGFHLDSDAIDYSLGVGIDWHFR